MTSTQALGAVAVGYDSTPHSDVALAWAVRHAAALHRPLLLVHACGVPRGYAGYGDASLTVTRHELRVAGRRVLNQGLALARKLDPDVELREHLAVGLPRDVLDEVTASGAHLLVVGTRGHGRVSSYLLGSVSEGVSVGATCPVVVVREHEVPDKHSPYAGRIVVGIDGTDVSRAALDAAFALASLEHRPLAVLHAWDDAVRWRDQTSYEVRRETSAEHEIQVAESLAGYREKYPDVAVSLHQVETDARWALVDASRHAHLVAVGSRGRGDTAALVLGSVSRYVVEHAHGPVMVARTDAS
jgi:nucleotide-binding universal stress UspA family protein